MLETATQASVNDDTNRRILAVSEDQLSGFHPDPFGDIASRTGVDVDDVIERVRAMLVAGSIRRVRQTLLSTRLATSALVAWKLPPERLNAAFDYMYQDDPFSGHVVLRSTDRDCPGGDFRLWTTLKVPQGFSLQKHCEVLGQRTDAEAYRVMPARCLFVLGVGHTRRRDMTPGARSDDAPQVIDTAVLRLSDTRWRVLAALKRPFEPSEIQRDVWAPRAVEAGMPLDTFVQEAGALDALGVVGRFSTFLEHVKPLQDGTRVTRYNGLFHWAVPRGRETDAGREIGRHHILTHAYWREAGPEFGNVNIMGVLHGLDKAEVLRHKDAIDANLSEAGIAISYTNVFWGGRSEIKPSEIMPDEYVAWCAANGIDPASMKEGA
jgi:hypothetical protein